MHSTSDASKDRPLLATPYARLAGRRFASCSPETFRRCTPRGSELWLVNLVRLGACRTLEARCCVGSRIAIRQDTWLARSRQVTPGLCIASHRIVPRRCIQIQHLVWGAVLSSHSRQHLDQPGTVAVPSPSETCIASGGSQSRSSSCTFSCPALREENDGGWMTCPVQ